MQHNSSSASASHANANGTGQTISQSSEQPLSAIEIQRRMELKEFYIERGDTLSAQLVDHMFHLSPSFEELKSQLLRRHNELPRNWKAEADDKTRYDKYKDMISKGVALKKVEAQMEKDGLDPAELGLLDSAKSNKMPRKSSVSQITENLVGITRKNSYASQATSQKSSESFSQNLQSVDRKRKLKPIVKKTKTKPNRSPSAAKVFANVHNPPRKGSVNGSPRVSFARRRSTLVELALQVDELHLEAYDGHRERKHKKGIATNKDPSENNDSYVDDSGSEVSSETINGKKKQNVYRPNNRRQKPADPARPRRQSIEEKEESEKALGDPDRRLVMFTRRDADDITIDPSHRSQFIFDARQTLTEPSKKSMAVGSSPRNTKINFVGNASDAEIKMVAKLAQEHKIGHLHDYKSYFPSPDSTMRKTSVVGIGRKTTQRDQSRKTSINAFPSMSTTSNTSLGLPNEAVNLKEETEHLIKRQDSDYELEFLPAPKRGTLIPDHKQQVDSVGVDFAGAGSDNVPAQQRHLAPPGLSLNKGAIISEGQIAGQVPPIAPPRKQGRPSRAPIVKKNSNDI